MANQRSGASGKLVIDTRPLSAHNAHMAGQSVTGWRGLLRRSLLPAALCAVCGSWFLLSQIPVIPGARGPLLLGPDGMITFLERPTIDMRYAFRGELPSPLKLVYVDVDGESLAALGNFPWNRGIFAQVTDALFRYGRIRALGFDLLFSSAGIPNLGRAEAEEGTLALGRSIREHRAVVVAASYSSGLGPLGKRKSFPFLYDRRTTPYDADLPELPEFPVVGPTWGRIGLIDVANDDVRSVSMFARTQHQTYLAMSLELAMLHYGLPSSAAEIGEDAIVLRSDRGEVLRIPLWLRQFVEPNWFSPWVSAQNPRTGVAALLERARAMVGGNSAEKDEATAFFARFRDAIVLVGPTDPMLKDVAPAPLSEGVVPRVSVHGNMLKTIVGNRYIKRPPPWVNALLIFALGLGVAALAVTGDRGRFALGRWFSLLLAAAYVVAAFMLFARFDLLVPLTAPIGAAACCFLIGVISRLAAEEDRRRRIKGLFGSYVSAAVVEEIVEKDIVPQTGGAEVEVTAFFSDIASFSGLSERLSPTELVSLMSEYFAEGTAAITAAGGTLDKYVGDAIVAIFGAPLQRSDHAAAACRAALALVAVQDALRRRWSEGGLALPPEVLRMRTRVGLNTGTAVVGNIGSPLRFNYTMMGSEVNLAQRMEAAAAHYGVEVLVSASTAQAALGHDPSLVFRELDTIKVAGRDFSSLGIFQLLGEGEAAEKANSERIRSYGHALALYREGRWSEAASAFAAAAGFEAALVGTNPCVVMADRCKKFRAEERPAGQVHSVPKN